MKALVTGATGFIGSVLVRELVKENHPVRALVLEGEDADRLKGADVDVWRGDLEKKETLGGICDGIDTVFHCAARVTDWGKKKLFYRAILDATRNLLEESSNKDVRFVYLSSITALGLGRHLKGAKETDLPRKSGVPYNDAKADAEKLCLDYHDKGKVSCTIVRPANVTGPGSVWVRDIINNMKKMTGVPLVDGGRHSSSFVYVDNLAEGIIRAGTMETAIGKTYHFRDDWDVTWKQYITDLGAMIGKAPRGNISFGLAWTIGAAMEATLNPLNCRSPLTRLAAGVTGRNNDVDTSLARSELGWETTISYEEAMERIAQWIKAGLQKPG